MSAREAGAAGVATLTASALVALAALSACAPPGYLPIVRDPDILRGEYMQWLDRGQTPARAVALVRERSTGWREVAADETVQPVAAGDRLMFVARDRSVLLVVVGTEPLATRGARLIGAHIDTPSPRLFPGTLTRGGQHTITAYRYGGTRDHHWLHRPLALVGRVATTGDEAGRPAEIDVELGREGDDFAFYITERRGRAFVVTTGSLPPADPKKQRQVRARPGDAGSTVRVPDTRTKPPAESAPVPAGAPATGNASGAADDASPTDFVGVLHARYGITAGDLEAAELYLVPRERARLVGVDGALIGAHGQDDRANSYLAWRAIADLHVETTAPAQTAMVWLVDREEEGSRGQAGARARFLEMVFAYLLRAQGARATEAALGRAFAASLALSADTPPALNPNWPEVHEPKHAPLLGRGPAMFPFTGHGGKDGGSAAHAELVASVLASFERAGAPLQYGQLGRVDEGGGGTIAKFLGERGIDVVDVGVCVVGMHSPMELTSVADLWAGYRGFRAWLAGR